MNVKSQEMKQSLLMNEKVLLINTNLTLNDALNYQFLY